MTTLRRTLILLTLAAAVTATLALKPRGGDAPAGEMTATALPRLVDLGATSCVPCRMMAPILEDLERDYAGRFEVRFIDVWQTPEAGEPFRIRAIPTQIFFDGEGRELFRHEGFYSRAEILGRWQALGYPFADGATPAR